MTVITRFAPSPTGFLHIGSARTALFNWLFARRYQGKFLLRIEDTDRERSTDIAIQAIIDGMEWLGLDHDDEVIFQFSRAKRHAEIAHQMVEDGKAYYCYTPAAELQAWREQSRQEGKNERFQSPWRDKTHITAQADVKPVIRLKAPIDGETVIDDIVQGKVVVRNDQLDDMVLLRSDGTPTYMLAVVVDDHDMGVTHIIRGDDHLVNAARQILIYQTMGWNIPSFAHIPLIHGADGAKLSKRHGALGVEAYRDMGYLPETMRNYLLRMGWGHGNEEIISDDKAKTWFSLEQIGRAPARFDQAKLDHLNMHYLKAMSEVALHKHLVERLEQYTHHSITMHEQQRLLAAIPLLVPRVHTLVELVTAARCYLDEEPSIYQQDTIDLLPSVIPLCHEIYNKIESCPSWDRATLEGLIKELAAAKEVKLNVYAQALRIALLGQLHTPSVFDLMIILGRHETLRRLEKLKNKEQS
jgi:glutamyl-tRNA synthetase